MGGTGGVAAWSVAVVTVAVFVGCHRPQAKRTGEVASEAVPTKTDTFTLSPAGTLPSGCAVAMGVDPTALRPAMDVLGRLLNTVTRTHGAMFGIDSNTALRRITGCKMPGHATRYVVLMSGGIPSTVVENAISDQRRGYRAETLGGLTIAGRPTSWIARRGASDAGDLVLASDRELLIATLVGPPTSYRLDPEAPFSAVVTGQELRNILAGQQNVADTGLDRVQEVAMIVPPGLRAIEIRIRAGDALVSEKLARSLRPLLSTVAASLVGGGRSPPELTTTIEAGDLLFRAELAAGSWEAIATRLLPGKNRH